MSIVLGVALDANQDGRLELVTTSMEKDSRDAEAIWHAWQTAPNGSWTGWHLLGRPGGDTGYSQPAMTRNGDGCLDVVVTTVDAIVWHRRQTTSNNGWSPWQSLGRPGGHEPKFNPGVAPALGINAAGHLEVFVIVEDRVWHAAEQPGRIWSEWSSLGQPGGQDPEALAVKANADGRLELFTTGIRAGDRQAVWHRWQRAAGGWSDWSSLGTPVPGIRPGVPTLFRHPDGCLELFIVASDGALWRRRQHIPGGGWSDWSSLGSPDGGFSDLCDVGVGATADGRPLVVAMPGEGTDVWQREQSLRGDDWSPWASITTPATTPVQEARLASNADRRLELFLRTEGMPSVYQLSQTTPKGPWSPGRHWPSP
jgi:hypothetical protein